jgi:hypothetical protein
MNSFVMEYSLMFFCPQPLAFPGIKFMVSVDKTFNGRRESLKASCGPCIGILSNRVVDRTIQ